MRHSIELGVALLLLASGEGLASGDRPPPCRDGLWVRAGNMTTPRQGHAATLLSSGKVLVAGGVNEAGAILATAELYDPATAAWSPTGSMNIPRWGATITSLPTGKVLVAGGGNSEGNDTRPAELYDPDTGQWATTGAMLVARTVHTMTALLTGKVLVAAGRGGPREGDLPSAELYDPATGEWHPTGALSVSRDVHTATLLDSGQVLVLGGLPVTASASAELYDPAAGAWTPAASMPTARWVHTATRLSSGAVLVAGGGGPREGLLASAELYDPAAGTWRPTGSLSTPHFAHTATRLTSGRVLVVGGSFGPLGPFQEAVLDNTELFDPESETWSDAGCSIEARAAGHTATLLRSGAVLVAGGSNSSDRTTSSAELYGIIVSPAQMSLAPGASQSFTASGGSGGDYAWSFVQDGSGGTLTASGDYQAGPVDGVTDVLRVVDAYANSATAIVNVLRQPTAVSATEPQAKTMGCATAGGAALPSLAGAFLVLLGWRWVRVRRPRRTSQGRADG